MPEQELSLLVSLRDNASAQLRQLNAEVKQHAATWKESLGSIQQDLQRSGIALLGFGGAITGAFMMAYQASERQRMENAQLANQLKNVGVAYTDVKASIDTYIEATIKATGYSQSEQMAALSRLILITGDYTQAMKYMPLVLDLASAAHMDTTQAAQLLGRVLEGDVNILHRYLGAMDGATTSAQALNWMQTNLKGTAESQNTPWKQLTTQLESLKEAIGLLVTDAMTKFLTKAGEVIEKVKDWVEKNPEAARTITQIAIAVGVAATIMGAMTLAALGLSLSLALLGSPVTLVLLAITALVAYGVWLALSWDDLSTASKILAGVLGILMLAFIATFGTVGIVIAAVAVLVAAGIFLALNWDKVAKWWGDVWEWMRNAPIIGPIIRAIDALITHWDKFGSFWGNVWNEIKVIALGAVNALFSMAEWFANLFLIPIEKAANGAIALFEGIANAAKRAWAFVRGEAYTPFDFGRVNIHAGESGNWSIPRMTEDQFGITRPGQGRPGFGGGVTSGVPEVIGPMPVPGYGGYQEFGNYGNLGSTITMGKESLDALLKSYQDAAAQQANASAENKALQEQINALNDKLKGTISSPAAPAMGPAISINVQGSVMTGEDLSNLIRQELIKLQNRNGTTGIQ